MKITPPVTPEQAERRAAEPPVLARLGRNRCPDRVVPYVNPLVSWWIGLRNDHGLSQKQLAARIGVSQPYVVALEQGKREPTWALLGRILLAFPDLDRADMAYAVVRYVEFAAETVALADGARLLNELRDADEGRAMVHPTLDSSSSVEVPR